jgi:aminoglycoside phosphotransferase (APT) family kinase protein
MGSRRRLCRPSATEVERSVARVSDLRKVGEGREAEIFEWNDGTVVRLLRDPGNESRIAIEAAAMRAAALSSVPVPVVGKVVTIDGRSGLEMERIDGPDLFTLIGRKPWRFPEVAGLLGTIHAQLHTVVAPTELPVLRDRIQERIACAPVLPARLATHALDTLDGLPDGDAICHGDFHPGNLLLGKEGPVVIDWVNATRGDAFADVARTRLMLRVGAIPPGTPRIISALQRLGRDGFRLLYLRSYRRQRAIDNALVDKWEVVRAADRLAEGITEEVPALLAVLERSAS